MTRLLAPSLVLLAGAAHAQGIPGTPAAPPAPSASAAEPAPPVPAPSAPAPAFTPAPEPSFTPPAAVPPSGTPEAAGAPAYTAPAFIAGQPFAPAPPPPVSPPSPSPSPSYGVTPSAPPLGEREASDAARAADAHLDRVLLLPTGETHPAGTAYFSSYEIVGLQAGYALSDRMQLTLSFVPPLTKDPLVPLDLTLKGVIVRSSRVRVALMASASGLFGFEQGNAAVGRLGGVTQFCFDDGCRSSVNMGVNLALVGPVTIVADGIGAVFHASRIVSFLVEIQSVLPLGRDGAEIHALGGGGGLRLSGKHFGVDLAFEGALDRKTKPQAIPLVIFTYRFGT